MSFEKPKTIFNEQDPIEQNSQKEENSQDQKFQETERVEEKKLEASLEKFPKPEDYLEIMKESGFPEHAEVYEKVLNFSQIVKENGGKALLVGGSVRDSLMNRISKDFDLEVYGLDPKRIEGIAEQIGKVSDVGKAFGILKITFENGLDIDISLPRTDSKIDVGHKGFDVKADPNMNLRDAARRRDFTINSIAANPLTGELYDSFNGIEDIKNRILRVTDSERFKDDPLRVLRAVQFVGRFGLEVEKGSMTAIQETVPQLQELSKERIGEEWKKLLLRSEKPSLGLSAGMMLGIFKEIHPEFSSLEETQQESKWHPEGNVWTHTLMVIDEAAKIVQRKNLESKKSLVVLLGSLCHDLGKPMTTRERKGHITSYGHEMTGEKPTKDFLTTIGIDNLTRDKVIKLVGNHLVPTMFYAKEIVRGEAISDGAIRRLSKKIHPATIQELVYLSEADHLGRGNSDPETKEQLLLPDDRFPAGAWLLKRARKLEVESSRPADLTRGRDWVNLGYKPGIVIGELISLSNDLRDEKDFSREMVFQLVDSIDNSSDVVEKLKSVLGAKEDLLKSKL